MLKQPLLAKTSPDAWAERNTSLEKTYRKLIESLAVLSQHVFQLTSGCQAATG